MDLHSIARLGKVIRPRSLLRGAKIAHHLRRLRRNQWRSPEELRRIQWQRLRTIVQHASNNVPYYRKLFDRAGFKPADLRDFDDLRKIPITTKADLRDHYEDTLSSRFKPWHHRVSITSGSTGAPVRLVRDERALAISVASKAYAFLECGVRLTDRFATLGRTDGAILPNHKTMLPTDPRSVVEFLNAVTPDVVYAYPTVLQGLGDYDVSGINPRLVFSQGSTLTDLHRDIVQSLFGTEVFDTYGSTEFSRLAFECSRHSGLHTITDHAVVEFLADGEPVRMDHPGEIVVTGLHNRVQPLIRYKLDDIGVPTDEVCGCGRSWPLIKSIEGRAVDRLLMPSGLRIPPGAIYMAIYPEVADHPFCISQFQAVQVKRDLIVLKVVEGPQPDPEVVTRMGTGIARRLLEFGEKVRVETEIVDRIDREPSGKIRSIISLAENEPVS